MAFSSHLKGFFIAFIVAFISTAVVIYLYNLIFHGGSEIDWTYPVVFGIIFGIIFGISSLKEEK